MPDQSLAHTPLPSGWATIIESAIGYHRGHAALTSSFVPRRRKARLGGCTRNHWATLYLLPLPSASFSRLSLPALASLLSVTFAVPARPAPAADG